MTNEPPGTAWARHSDPVTSRMAGVGGRSAYRNGRERALGIIAVLERLGQAEDGLTSEEVVRKAQELGVSLGTSPWKRISECRDEGWTYILRDGNGQERHRMETKGQPQMLFRITDQGWAMVMNSLLRRTR